MKGASLLKMIVGRKVDDNEVDFQWESISEVMMRLGRRMQITINEGIMPGHRM